MLFFLIFFDFITQSRTKMLVFWIIPTLLFGISIFWYWGIDGLTVSLISILVKLCSLFFWKEQLKYLKYSTFPLSLFLFFLLPEGIEGLIPSLSTIFIILADSQTDLIKMKQLYYWSNLLWLSYWIILFSPSAILFDVIWFFSITYWIYKLKKKKQILKK